MKQESFPKELSRMLLKGAVTGAVVLQSLLPLPIWALDMYESGDDDGDGWAVPFDCDDSNPFVHPGATEVCDGIDNNCDGNVDEGYTTTWYADWDGDGYGDPNYFIFSCWPSWPYSTADNTDCNPWNGTVYPGAPEVCDGVDNNCDGNTDEGYAVTSWYADYDYDGYGDPNNSIVSCAPIWPYTTTDNTDCEPWNPIVNPGAYEWCDYVDNNCNGQIDEGYNTTWYADLDSDGYGDPSSSTTSCWPIWPYTATNNTDCDPLNWIVNPGATEVCDGLDNNCDGNTDEGYLITSWYADYDYDGYGDPNNSITGCSSSWPYTTTDNTDCDPWNSSVYPGAYEWCDYMDNNCNGQIDEGYNTTWYADMDGDSYGNPNSFVVSCYPYWPYYNMNNTDCDDGNAAVNPGAAEVCFNGIDDNCSGSVDENDVSVSVSPSGSMTVCHGVPVLLSSSVSGSGPYTYQWYRGANAQAGATDPTYTTTKKGTFYVVVSNGSCVATSNSVSISRIPSPPANITNVTGTNDLCAAGGSITLKANGTAYTYQWKKDGVYTGQTTKFITVNAPGSYTVEVTNSNGCTKESAPVNIISCSERSTLVADASIRLYPNPTDGGQVFLSAPLSGDGPATITVSTLPGQEVLRTVVNSEGGLLQTTLTLPAGLASGTYVVKLVSGNSTVTRQLVLQR